ncbi:MAG: hypothetical protein IPO88_25915 [Nannocystis sp.]|uniref:hypothetical protein n=1 Tax=Nannocystis sp. TaxID=1962667 RepID=UPI002424CECC|nr:hypothetical protein [Nannocystis sp.]MBK9756872.1 hypothetical protein [Nannocystis sp.]
MKHTLAVVALSLFLGPVTGCDSGDKKSIADQIGPATKGVADIKKGPEVSEEELQRRRKEAGFKTKEEVDAELAAENAKMFEKGDREYIKARVKDYRKLTADTRTLLADIEKEAGKWASAKDPQKAFDKTGEALGKRAKDQQKQLDKLSEKGIKGGNTQVILNKAFRPLEELQGALGPELGKDEKFAEALKTIRAALDEAEAAFTEIEKDETLIASKFAKVEGEEGAEGEDAEGEGAKPDEGKAKGKAKGK